MENIIPVVESIYEEKSQIVNECNFNFYDMHDAKMLYLITQHSSWSRKNHPFLLCKCQRGEGVVDESHECITIKDDELLQLYNCSTRRWERKTSKDETYPTKDHADWVDEKNFEGTLQKIMQIGLMKRTLKFHILDCCYYIFKEKISDLMSFIFVLQSPKD